MSGNAPPSPIVPSASGRPRRAARPGSAILLSAVVIAAVALFLPWWGATEAVAGETWTQTFSPITGVSGSCASLCPGFNPGPPSGPLQGQRSFSALGLNATGVIYELAFALALAGVVSGLLAFAVAPSWNGVGKSPRRNRLRAALESVALAGLALGTAVLPLFQPAALRSDTGSTYAGPVSWTPSPSPETSFWGGCSPGATHGLCASGWSASWTPGVGWALLVLAVILLVALHFAALRNRPAVSQVSIR